MKKESPEVILLSVRKSDLKVLEQMKWKEKMENEQSLSDTGN